MQMFRLHHARRSDRGASAVEYALFLALIAAVMVPGLMLLGPTLAAAYTAATTGW